MIINDIEPFNEIYFKGCFYNAFFPICLRLGIPIDFFLFNDLILYDENLSTGIEYKSEKTINDLIIELGIEVSTKYDPNNLVKELRYYISKDIPVILCIDCFYESIRIDTYQVMHWPHNLLFVGFDDMNEVFYVIEHHYRDGLTYQRRELSYKEVKAAHAGFIDYFSNLEDVPLFMAVNNGVKIESKSKEKFALGYIKRICANQQLIRHHLNNLMKISEKINKLVLTNLNKEEIMRSLDGINAIIHGKEAEIYRLKRLGRTYINLYDYQYNIFQLWCNVRVFLAKYYYSDGKIPLKMGKLGMILSDIKKNEESYYQFIYLKYLSS